MPITPVLVALKPHERLGFCIRLNKACISQRDPILPIGVDLD